MMNFNKNSKKGFTVTAAILLIGATLLVIFGFEVISASNAQSQCITYENNQMAHAQPELDQLNNTSIVSSQPNVRATVNYREGQCQIYNDAFTTAYKYYSVNTGNAGQIEDSITANLKQQGYALESANYYYSSGNYYDHCGVSSSINYKNISNSAILLVNISNYEDNAYSVVCTNVEHRISGSTFRTYNARYISANLRFGLIK